MGCALSKKDEEEDVVALCRDRKRLLKLAVERRYAFADSQCKYNKSLYAVAMAIRLFVARHSSSSTHLFITFPTSSEPSTHPMLLKHTPTQATLETFPCQGTNLASFKPLREEQEKEDRQENGREEMEGESEEESESEDEEMVCEHFYDEVASPAMLSPTQAKMEFSWDFFNPFDEVRAEEVNGFCQGSDEDLRAVREKEGIPELEEDGAQRVMGDTEAVNLKHGKVGHEVRRNTDDRSREGEVAKMDIVRESKGLKVIDTPTNERELLDALKDIEDHFVRAYDSGLDISRMLEVNKVPLQSGLEEIKENSNKLIRSMTWNRSTSFRSPSCRSLLTSSSMNSSMWAESKTDTFDDYGMESGSHSLTLGRLYIWEKKLFHEVKTGDLHQKMLKRKCSRWRTKKARGGASSTDKAGDEMMELHSRVIVAIRSVESISNRIQKLRDEELHPQLLELLHGLMRNWKIMLDLHATQSKVMLEVKSFSCPAYGKFCNDSHRLATLQLEAEVDNWRSSFAAYISSQKAYIEALSGWLSKFIAPEVDIYTSNKSVQINGPPLLVTCHRWLALFQNLPDKSVISAMKSFVKDIHAMWNQQGEEQQQKRKVDGLAKELEKKALAFQRAERRILEAKISEQEPEVGIRNRIDYLTERKTLVDMCRQRLEAEKGKHLSSMQDTQRITITGFQTGFSSVLESLAEFSKASVKMYAELVTYSANAKTAGTNGGKLSYMKS